MLDADMYREYLGQIGSMAVVSLSHSGLDLVKAMVLLLQLRNHVVILVVKSALNF